MNKEKAKAQLGEFLKGRVLTFSITNHLDNEWVAECNEIPGIITGGSGDDITNRDDLIRDAICTAAGVDTKYAKDILKFVGYKPTGPLEDFFNTNGKKDRKMAEAEYVPS